MVNINGYRFEAVHGRAAFAKNEPITEEGKFETLQFPVRMFLDERVDGDDILPHMHKAIEILCIISGEIQVVVNGDSHQMKENSIVVLNSYDVHAFSGKEAYYYVIQAEPTLLNSFDVNLQQYMPADGDKFLKAEDGETMELRKTISSAFEYGKNGEKAAQIGMIAEIFSVFAQIMAYTEARGDYLEQPGHEQNLAKRLQDVFAYVEVHSANDIPVDEISRHVNLTKNYFCRFFKRMTGMTFVEYLNQYRCKRAEELMVDMDISITEIALQVGFKSLSYFNKTYKKLRGETPSEKRSRILRSRFER
ncbi:AraC family transcriptional regulator [Ruminococcus sp. OA3]|uniref:AraC family transcriptional regulator n=1 Tax=Ruminococcus sp. OA3 TaxID=2914164 RepID=UPI001F067406|nr:AraC family transcriptional regulator [Ruminococcus sp. OA3]MCH1981465.1 AraC family transcriptional regulator [Ruminococcus sp. OA3]